MYTGVAPGSFTPIGFRSAGQAHEDDVGFRAVTPALLWFRRDLRLADHAALLTAADRAPRVLALFVLDPALLGPAGPVRRTLLYRCLHALDESLGGRLLVVRGEPADVVPRVARSVGAGSVHVSADYGPYGARRDAAVAAALDGGVALEATGSPYAVAPGRIRTGAGEPYKVFTPFRRAWTRHGWRRPADTGASMVDWIDPSEKDGGPRAVRIPGDERVDAELPEVGERAARVAWDRFRERRITGYDRDRDLPGVEGTSRMSPHLKYGTVHPRTLLADLAGEQGNGAETFRTELAWRDFYADVLHHNPDSARRNYDRRFDVIDHDTGGAGGAAFEAWAQGRTGFPIVDAGMRQLLAEAWMHNRLRMIVASFLVKDLHLPWWWGARHFLRHLADGDLASNNHGWQWVAGSGTDAAPYFRVFNPVTQGQRFDPDGGYVRRYVPELRDVPDQRVHTPWELPGGLPDGYPPRMVDHAAERHVALQRYETVKAAAR